MVYRLMKIGFIGAIMSIASIGMAQTQVKLSADTIVLGDQTTLIIPQTSAYPSTEQLSQNGIVAVKQEFDSTHNAMLTTLTSFEPGVHYIKLSDADSLPLMVMDVDVDTTTTEIRDIADVEGVPYSFWEIFRWVLLGLGMLALASATWWIYTHRRKIQEVVGLAAPEDKRTAEERALDNLEALRKKQLWQSGQTKEYYTELTDTIRIFIEESTEIRATEMTSEECVNALTLKYASAEETTLLQDVFTKADLVKFAKGEPLPYEHQRVFDESISIVKGLWEKVNAEIKSMAEISANETVKRKEAENA